MKLVAIILPCHQCKRINRLAISSTNSRSKPVCGSCGSVRLDFLVVNDFLYLLSNPAMPGLIKIGFTDRSVEERVKELNSGTGIPVPFVIEAYFGSHQPERDEKAVHLALGHCKAPGKEFFAIKLQQALDVVLRALGRSPMYVKSNS